MEYESSSTLRALVREFLREQYGPITAKDLAQNHGKRIGVRDGQIELASDYYYKSQASTVALLKDFGEFLKKKSLKAVVIDWNGQPVAETVNPNAMIHFADRPWPKTCWASLWIKVQSL